MAVAFVRGNNSVIAPGNALVSTCSFPTNTAGNLLVVGVLINFGGSATISDTANNIWQTAIIQFPNINYGLRLFYAENCKASAGTNTVTVTISSLGHLDMCIGEWSGVATSLSFSGGAQSSNTLSATVSPITSGDLIIALGFQATTAGAGLTARESSLSDRLLLADGTASGTSFAATMTGSGFASIIAVAFHASPAPDEGRYKGGDYSMSDGSTGSYSESANFVSNTAGDALVAFVLVGVTPTSLSVSDTAGNTWSLITSIGSFYAYCVPNCAASSGENTVTATALLPSGSRLRIWIAEYAALTVTASATAGATILSISSAVGSLVVAGYQDSTSSAVGAGTAFTARKTSGDMLIEDAIATTNPTTVSVSSGGGVSALIALALGAAVVANAQPFVWVVF